MQALQLTKTRFVEGVWTGILTGAETPPALSVTHHGKPVAEPDLTEQPDNGWLVEIALPPQLMSDGVQTVLISDQASGAQLETLHIMAGEALDDDLRAEVQLLREELDMLKRAFRRHCVETL